MALSLNARLPKETLSAAALALLLWLLVAALAFVLLLNERRLALERAEKTAMAMTLVMEAHTSSIFHSVDLVLAGVVDTYLVDEPEPNDPEFQAILRARVRDLPYLRAIFIIGPDGYLLHDTDYPDTPRASLADRQYFHEYLDDASLQKSVSGPLYSRSGFGWFNAVTRRISRNGRFAGVAVAAVVPSYFEGLYRRMGLGEGQSIELFYEDFTRVARYPDDDATLGRQAGPQEVFGSDEPVETAGTRIARDGLLRVRMTSFRALDQQPFIVTLTQGPPSLLAGWRNTLAGALLALVSLGVMAAALFVQIMRKQQMAARARERLIQSERLEAIGQLTGGIAHDFANLLGIVRTNLSIIERTNTSEPCVGKAVATANRAIDGGKRLVEQLLAFAKQGELDVRPIDLNRTLRTHVGMFEQAAGSIARVELDLDESIGPCLADETQVVVALVNLVANARDAMIERGTITIRTAKVGPTQSAHWGLGSPASVRVTVVDQGVGMDEEVRRRAFDPFFSTKGAAGTGLGLAQVYGFVRQLGGDVRIDSSPGQGTSIHLYFPCADARSAPDA